MTLLGRKRSRTCWRQPRSAPPGQKTLHDDLIRAGLREHVMRRRFAVVSAVLVAMAACAPASAERVVRVDYRHDEFASFFWRFFPGRIEAHPGDTIAFQQRWTG